MSIPKELSPAKMAIKYRKDSKFPTRQSFQNP